MKNLKKFIAIFALVVMLGVSASMLFACDKDIELMVNQQFKTEYYVGEQLDVTNGMLKYTDENKEVKMVPVATTMVSDFSTELPGTRNMVITYEKGTVLVQYTVIANDIKSGTYYKATQPTNGKNVYYVFNLQQNIITQILSLGTPSEKVDEDKILDITAKTTTAQGFIEYTAKYRDADVTIKITDITKTSFKIASTSGEYQYDFLEYQAA